MGICAAIALAISLVALTLVRRRPWLAAGLIVFVAGVGPVLGLVPFYFQSYSTVADRYAYLAMAGVAIVVAFAMREFGLACDALPATRRSRILHATIGVILLALAILTGVQVGVWHDTTALMTQAYVVNPDSIAANGQLGLMAQRAGRFDFAEQAFRKVLAQRPYDSAIRAQYAGVLLRTNRAEAAVAEFLRVVDEQPDNARAFNGLGLAFAACGRDSDALPAFGRAATLDPSLPDAPANAGDVLVRSGDLSRARAAYAAALRIDPRQSTAIAGLRALPPER